MFVDEPLAEVAQDGLHTPTMTHAVASLFQGDQVDLDGGTCQLVEVRR